MAIDKIGSAGGVGASPALESGKEQFGKVLQAVQGTGSGPKVPVASEAAPRPVASEAVRGADHAKTVDRASAGKVEAAAGTRVDAARMLDRVDQAQKRLDSILKLAESGKSFSPAELLALQAHVYRASQELDLAGKVVEKATSGVKQVLQTQV